MRREPSLTFEGALQILGQHEHKIIARIDKLLGGVILAGGGAGAAVALGAPPLAPLVALGAVWGWADQKGLTVELLASAVDAVAGKASRLRGQEKRELIAAAHSTIVVAAVFEAFREHVDDGFYARLKVPEGENPFVRDPLMPDASNAISRALYTAEVPAPSGACGFSENIDLVSAYQVTLIKGLDGFADAFRTADGPRIDRAAVILEARERYVSHYLRLAAKVPEFSIWSQLGEHAATRRAVSDARTAIQGLDSAVRQANADVVSALNATRDVLNRVTWLLSAGQSRGTGESGPGPGEGQRAAVARANAGIMTKGIVPADPERYPGGLIIPRVGEIYINPRCRVAEFTRDAQPSNEQWWGGRLSRDHFDVLFAAHVTSPNATRLPMLLLGHPGAGKSLLMKVLAARLPDWDYTVVRVPLRQVSADASIRRQIEEALEKSTDAPIVWSELAEQGARAVRVVLLDGLDELLQASKHDRSSYLEDVVDFQERGLEQQRPTIVVVTSRTVVADRVRIPEGTMIVKLEPFNADDIADWVARWNRVNATPIAAGTVGTLTLSAARRQRELAEQPLLLLMLALYAADRSLKPLDENMGTAELYQRLLDGFARRETGKDLRAGHDPGPEQVDERVRDHLERLSVAALGMFNRGRQDIDEEELVADLRALIPEPRWKSRLWPAEPGKRIIGEFFFVHAPESQTLAGQQGRHGQPKRAYEFLHATFGEYLVARHVMKALGDTAARAFVGDQADTAPDDDLLFALLSHQVLVARRSMLDFARAIFAAHAVGKREQVLATLELLIITYRNRLGSQKYTAYQPVPPDQVRQLACYSANLLALRTQLETDPEGVPLAQLLPAPDDVLAQWRSTPNLWKAGLDIDGLVAMLNTVEIHGEPPRLRVNRARDLSYIPFEISLARLARDHTTETRLRYGTAIFDQVTYYNNGDSWKEAMSSWLIATMAGASPAPVLKRPPAETTNPDVQHVADLAFQCLAATRRDARQHILDFIFSLPPGFKIDENALIATVIRDPQLFGRYPELADFRLFGDYQDLVRRFMKQEPRWNQLNSADLSEENARAIVAYILRDRYTTGTY
jgi:hypothetical protein